MPQERSIIRMIVNNFMNSIRPRQFKGNLMGKDHFGNQYFEIPADPSIGKRKANRWFQPRETDKFDQEMPSEWEAWLRYRRDKPPTDEEVKTNLAVAELKKKNAEELGYIKPQEKIQQFPKYDDYEIMPGENQDKEKK